MSKHKLTSRLASRLTSLVLSILLVATTLTATAFAETPTGGDPFQGEILFPFNEGNGSTSSALSDGLTATLDNYVWDQNGRGDTPAISNDQTGKNGFTIDYGNPFASVNDLTMGVWVKPSAPSPGTTSSLMAPPYAGTTGDWGFNNGEIWWSINWGTSANNFADTNISFLSYGSDGSAWDGGISAPAGNLADGNWHYLAFSLSATAKTVALYVDGNPIGQKDYSSLYPVNLQAYKWFGGNGYQGKAYTGLLDELSVFPTVLDDTAHAALNNRAPNTSGGGNPGDPFPGEILFPFNEGNGSTSSALSDGLTATLNNYVWDIDHNGRGDTSAISTDSRGASGLTIDYGAPFANVNDLTMGVWVKPSAPSPGTSSYVMAPPYGGSDGSWGLNAGEIWWSIGWGTSENNYADTKINFTSYGSDGSEWDSNISAPAGNLADGDWHYLAFSFSATAKTVSLYVDGSLIGEKTYTSTFPVNLQAYKWFGGAGYNGSAYTGFLDELSVFTSVLDGAAHAALYNRAPNTDGTGQQADPADTDQIGDKTYHVAKTGSDSNPGTEAAPFLTIQKAADVLLPGETVIIHEGVYEESVRPKYNGTADHPVTYKAANGEKVVISGADLITGAWQTASNTSAVEYNANDANLWKVDVSLPMGNYRNQIFVDGEAMLPSRYPNVAKEDAYYRPNWLTYVFDGANASVGGWSNPNGKLRDPELNQPAGTWDGAAIVGVDNREWNLSGAEVVSSTPGWLNLTNINFYELGPTGYASGDDFHYYIQNAMAALDAPYEWFYNQNSETLYLQLPNGMNPNDLDVRYKAREWGLDLSSRKYIHIEGIDLNGCSLTMRNGVSNVVDKMTAKYVTEFLSPDDERGGIIVGGKNNTLINSEIGYSAGALVTVEGEGNKIVNSKLHDATTGPTLFTFSITISGINHLISHNEVYNASGTLIGGSFYASEISYNDIHDGNWHSTDAGLMYFAYNDYGNSQIHHNKIHDSHSGFSNGVYFDLGCKNALVYGNVFWNLPWVAVFINSSSEFISVVNNTVYHGATNHSNPEIYTNSPGDAYMDVFMNNIVDSRGVGTDNVNAGAVVMDNYSRPNDDIDGTATFNNPSAFDFTLKPGSDAVGMGAYQPGDTWNAGLKGTPVTVEEVSSGPQLLPYANRNLLLNSGFEWPRVGFPSMGSLPYWEKTGTGSASIVQAGSSADNAHARDQYSVELTGQNIGLEQEITGLEPGTDYVLRGFARMGNGSSAEGQKVEIGVSVGANTFKGELDRPAWRSVSIKFTADQTGTATVYAKKTTDGSRALVDDLSVVRADLTPDLGPGSDDLYPMLNSPVALLDDMLFEDSEWTVAGESSFVKDEPSGLTLAAQPGQSAAAFYTQEKYSNKDFYLKLNESEDLDALDMNIILRANAATRTANRYEIDIQGATATLTRYYNGQGLQLGQWTVDINDRLLKAGAVWDDVNGSGYGGVTVTLKSGNETLFSVRDENNLNVSAPGYFGLATESSIKLGRVTEYVDMHSVIADKNNWKSGNSISWENNDTKLTPVGSATAGYTGRTFGDAEFVVGFESGMNTGAFPNFTLRAPTEEDLLNNPWSGTKYSVIFKEGSFEIQHWPELWKPGASILSDDGRSALADNKGFVPPYRDTLVKVSTVNTDYGVWIRVKAGDTIVASWMDENNYILNNGYFGIAGYTEPMSISVPNENTYIPVIGNPDDKPGNVGPTGPNYALGKPVTVSSEYSDQWSGTLSGSNAVDGDPETRWAATEGSSNPQWIQVDLNSMVAIKNLRLVWGSDYATSYEILVSSYGTDWTPLYATMSGNGEQDDILLNTPVEARYVKLNVLERSDAYWAASLMEIEVYGTVVTTEPPAIAVTGIIVTGASLIDELGETAQMAATVTPDNATDKSVEWTVTAVDGSATTAATIDANGLLTAVAEGTVKVVAMAKDGSNVRGESIVTIAIPPVSNGAHITGPAVVMEGQPFSLIYGVDQVTTSVYAMGLTVNYDPSLLQYIGNESLIDGYSVVGESDKPGAIRILVATTGATPVTGTADMLTLNFQALAPAQTVTGSVYLSNVKVANAEGMEIALHAGSAHQVQIVVPADKTALQLKIQEAQAKVAAATVGTNWGQYSESAVAALNAAITSANTVFGRQAATQAEVDQAVVDLEAAIQIFVGSANQQASLSDLGIMAGRYGATSASPDWLKLSMYDFDHNGELGIWDLSTMARKILDM